MWDHEIFVLVSGPLFSFQETEQVECEGNEVEICVQRTGGCVPVSASIGILCTRGHTHYRHCSIGVCTKQASEKGSILQDTHSY